MTAAHAVYLGPAGTFAEMAARALPQLEGARKEPASSVVAALDMVRAGGAGAAVVPMENSIEGSVSGTLDELAASPPLRIVGEVAIPVRFVLMRRMDELGSRVAAVGTHPHAAAQCRRWLHENLPDARVIHTQSTAGAAADLAEGSALFDAAIGTAAAAQRYGLSAVAVDIADNREAVTRFVLVERPGAVPARTGADKTSLVLYIRANRAGALREILTELDVRGINMTRLESRPTRHALGDYCFSVDIEGHVDDARVGEALVGLRRVCSDVLFLGSYPSLSGRSVEVPDGLSDDDFAAAAGWLEQIRRGAG